MPVMSKGVRGVRLNPQHDAKARAKIKTSQIINRLNGFVLQEPDHQTGKPIEMTTTQVNAALGLLRKTLPDLTSTTVKLDDDRELPDLTTEELKAIVAGIAQTGGGGTAEADGSEVPPDSVH